MESTYVGLGFLVDLTGLVLDCTTSPHLSSMSLVMTGPKLQFDGPGRGDQSGETSLPSWSTEGSEGPEGSNDGADEGSDESNDGPGEGVELGFGLEVC